METKICKKCGKELPIDEFAKAKQQKDGHLATCKKCRGAFQNTPDYITCPVCGEVKPYYEFAVAPKSSTGRMWACKTCMENKPKDISDTAYRRKYDKEFRKNLNQHKRQEFRDHIEQYIWFRAKQRAAKYGYDFNLEVSDIVIPKICPVLEVPIEIGTKDSYEYSPSLDRIDNSKGYIKGNVWVISKKANSMKNSATPEELSKFCKNIIRYSLNTAEHECSELRNKES
jgi:hypothetical protein